MFCQMPPAQRSAPDPSVISCLGTCIAFQKAAPSDQPRCLQQLAPGLGRSAALKRRFIIIIIIIPSSTSGYEWINEYRRPDRMIEVAE